MAATVFHLPQSLQLLLSLSARDSATSLNCINFPYIIALELPTENSHKFSLKSIAPRSSHRTLGSGVEGTKDMQGKMSSRKLLPQ